MKKRLAEYEIASIRYIDDKPFNNNHLLDKSNRLKKLRNQLILNHFPVNKKLFPKIYDHIEKCLFILGINQNEHNISLFIYSSSDINAKCLTGFDRNIIILLSSSLVKLLNGNELSFVVGHELGHYIFHRNEIERDLSLESFMILRAREISADRTGFLCAQSLDASIRAIAKLLSGLDESYINFNTYSMLQEFQKIDPSNIPYEEIYSTHPPFPIRVRALLWFSMSKTYLNLIEKDSSHGLDNKEVDFKIQNDIKKYSNGIYIDFLDSSKKDFQFWSLSLIFLRNNRFSQKEQSIISDLFGNKKLEQLISFLNLFSKKRL